VPVKNGAQYLDACLRSITRSRYRNIELIVVNDHSEDASVQIAEHNKCTILHTSNETGANHARNLGAQAANGDILVFVDADIVLERDAIITIVELLQEVGHDAVVGLYTTKHRHESFVSQYKNLWVRYSYLKSSPAIDWVFGAISGIKRRAFEALGGFDAKLMSVHGNDDIEFGKRLALNKLNIVLSMDVEVEHLKSYSLPSFIKNEFYRSIGFAELATRLGETVGSFSKGFANVYPTFILSVLLAPILLVIAISAAVNYVSYTPLLVVAGIYVLFNIRFLNYLEQVRGLFAMIAMVPILLLDHLVCFVGSVVGVFRGLTLKRR
ncbi:MAG: glycosyltransferase, partial [Ignavibacteriales bacterium]|nr:glycosyltransferase [Ignavibacteriales bacterium]